MNMLKRLEERGDKGMTIIELSLVMAILVSLAAMVLLASGGMEKWKKGKEAGETLRVVYIAQKAYMADHPTSDVSALTEAVLLPYLANGAAVFPVVNDADGNPMAVNVTVMPAVVSPDPSGDPDDGLWDVGKP